jgi:short chain dehydrogenase
MSTNITKKLAGKVAVVTGASKGIGASIAKHLAAEGASVVVNYASSKTGADKVVADITAAGGKAVAVQGDVSKKADIDRLFVETKKAYGQLDVLVNNAGIYEFAPLEQISEEHFHKQFNLNVLGLLLTTQEAVKYFGPAGGSVINSLQRHEGGGGCGHEIAGQGTRAEKNPRELDQSRHGGNGRRAFGGIFGNGISQDGRFADSARAHRPTAGHRQGRHILRVG